MPLKSPGKTSQLTLQEHSLLLLLLVLLVIGSMVRYRRYQPEVESARPNPTEDTPLSKPETDLPNAED